MAIKLKTFLTFDDVLLKPQFSDVLPKNVSINSRITKNITLNIPIISAAMDTVTESNLAIAMAQNGGIGCIHKNMTPIMQRKEVLRVKKYESAIVSDPITIFPENTISEALSLMRKNGISGIPVIDKNQIHKNYKQLERSFKFRNE